MNIFFLFWFKLWTESPPSDSDHNRMCTYLDAHLKIMQNEGHKLNPWCKDLQMCIPYVVICLTASQFSLCAVVLGNIMDADPTCL